MCSEMLSFTAETIQQQPDSEKHGFERKPKVCDEVEQKNAAGLATHFFSSAKARRQNSRAVNCQRVPINAYQFRLSVFSQLHSIQMELGVHALIR